MTSKIYSVKLDNIFEGPMDLLIHLIQKNEVDIYDIPIGIITDQYLEYVEWIESMNIDLAGDFLVMAATLTQIKSRMLLPVHGNEEDEEDPRAEITRPLLEYLQLKSAAEKLADREILGEHIFVRSSCKADLSEEPNELFIQVGLFELIEAFKNILDNISPKHRVDFSEERISIKDRIAEVTEILEKREWAVFDEFFVEKPSKPMLVVTFLAILEMVRLNLVRIVQHSHTGVIRLFYI